MKQFIDEQITLIDDGMRSVGLPWDNNRKDLMTLYIKELVSWNERMNLVSRSDLARLAARHILDSVVPLVAFDIPIDSSLLDIGSGAGFPAVPMKIVRPDLNFVLVESRRKKVRFLEHIGIALDLNRFVPVWSRVEDYNSDVLFDIVISRATANPVQLARWSIRLLKQGGGIALFLTERTRNELLNNSNDLEKLSYTIEKVAESPFADGYFVGLMRLSQYLEQICFPVS